MSEEPDVFALARLDDLCGLSAAQARRWAREDGWTLAPTDDGPGAPTAALRSSLRKRGLPVPRALEAWPRVLVADDDRDVLQIIVWLIQQAYPEAEVRAAADGDAALAELPAFQPHLLVTDLKMPGQGGLSLCRRVRGDRELSSTKILAISGHPSERNRESLFAEGASEFVAKPFDPRDLKASLERLLGPGPESPASLPRS